VDGTFLSGAQASGALDTLLLDHLTPENVERWRRQVDTPYEELSEPEKQGDREWADRVLELVGTSAPTEGREGGREPGQREGR
jgi:hypothetical protein